MILLANPRHCDQMYREMDMPYWLEQADAERKA